MNVNVLGCIWEGIYIKVPLFRFNTFLFLLSSGSETITTIIAKRAKRASL